MPLPIVGSAHVAPPAAGFTWFIYGSSLSRSAFAEWVERHGYPLPDFSAAIPARLEGFRLSFDVQSGFWGGAVASLAEAPGETVEGIALPMPAGAKVLVDHKEGALSGLFEPIAVQVVPLSGGALISAVAYRTSSGRRLPTEAPPSPSFVAALAVGAAEWRLSAPYLAKLAALKGD